MDDDEQQPSPVSTPRSGQRTRAAARTGGRAAATVERPEQDNPVVPPPAAATEATTAGAPVSPDAAVPVVPPARTVTHTSGLPDDRYLNRELSWLDFNARVLALAEDPSQPLLERAKFLAIFASNLDEFYMVRVAGLKRRDEAGLQVRSADGLTPREQLARISARTQALAVAHAKVFLDEVCPELDKEGIRINR